MAARVPFATARRVAAGMTALAFSIAAAGAQQARPEVKLGIGWSMLHLDKTEFTAVTDFFVTETIDHVEDHDGELNGYRLSGEIAGLLPHMRGSWQIDTAVKGFYSRYEDEQNSRCTFTEDTDCAFFPLFDPNPEGRIPPSGSGKQDPGNYAPDLSGGFFSDWRTTTDREAVHWGVAVEWRFTRAMQQQVSLKDAPQPVASPFQWRVGLGARQLDQETSLTSVDFGPTADPVTLDDDLDTTYYGAYVGFTTARELGRGYRLSLSGETGLYYSDTDYHGRYTATDTLGGGPIAQSISLDDTSPAFIGLLNLSLEKQLTWGSVGLFGEAEWISHVPTVLHNDTDRNGGFPFDTIGNQDGTELGNSSAFTYTLGAKVSVPLR